MSATTYLSQVHGTLDAPVPGPAAIDGPFEDRVRSTLTEFFPNRQRDAVSNGFSRGVDGPAEALAGLFTGRR